MNLSRLRIGLLWRGDPVARVPAPPETRLRRIFEGLDRLDVDAEPVVYAEEANAEVREQLLALDGVLVWVDPIVDGREREQLDATLREVAEQGLRVSAHPDVIMKMGTKLVLYDTREMEWGTDTRVYGSLPELAERLPDALRLGKPRVLKQYRGSSGDGVWRVEAVGERRGELVVRVQHARRGSVANELRWAQFLELCAPYFAAFGGAGNIVDQAYAERLGEGMIRCYLVRDRVAGFGHQFVTALAHPREGEAGPPDPSPRLYFGPDKPEFQRLRALVESRWVRQMQQLLGVEDEALPLIWDLDFLLGPKTAAGEDSYVLCEVNVSGVFPIPDESIAPLAEAAVTATMQSKARRVVRRRS